MDGVQAAREIESAQWVIDGLVGKGVCSIVPSGFQAYARILHPAWLWTFQDGQLTKEPLAWAEVATRRGRTAHRMMQWPNVSMLPIMDWDVVELLARGGYKVIDVPQEGTLTPVVAHSLLEKLEHFTQHSSTCWFGVWEGFGWDYKPGLEEPQAFGIHGHRAWHLFQGPLGAMKCSFFDADVHQSANLIWPEDRSWCIATEISLQSTYIGGTNELVASILDISAVEAYAANPDDDPYSDHINPPSPSSDYVVELRCIRPS